MTKATLVATLAAPAAPRGRELPQIPREAGWLEARGNPVSMPGADWLRARFHGRLILSMSGSGTEAIPSDEERHRLLARAADGYDMVDLDAERDLVPEMLALIAPSRRIITWRGPIDAMHAACRRCRSVDATLYRFIPEARSLADVFAPLAMLEALGRTDITAYASGADASWSRVLAPHLGAPVLFGGIGDAPYEPGEISIRRLIDDYDAPWLGPIDEVYGIIGRSVHGSLSPRLHNGGYRRLGRRAIYLPMPVASYDEFRGVVIDGGGFESLGMEFRGGTVSAPHKEAALAAADVASRLSRCCNAANNLVRRDGAWHADTTDAVGALHTLLDRGISIESARVLVVGCGGAGRAMAAGLKSAGADVTLMNRGTERGTFASALLGLPVLPLCDAAIAGYAVVVNATPVGRDTDEMPFAIGHVADDATVIDLVYGSAPTPLMTRSRERGLSVIDGRDVLRAQVYEQFRLLTGDRMPSEAMDAVLGSEMEPGEELLAVSG